MSRDDFVYGEITRELHEVWSRRMSANDGQIAAHPVLQSLFNDLRLFPSQSQLYEMVQCAREGSRVEEGQGLTFGEFCLFATELKKYYKSHEKDRKRANQHTNKSPTTTTTMTAAAFTIHALHFHLLLRQLPVSWHPSFPAPHLWLRTMLRVRHRATCK